MMPSSLLGLRPYFTSPAAGFGQPCALLCNCQSTALQTTMHKHRPDALSTIANAKAADVTFTPRKLRSNPAAKSP